MTDDRFTPRPLARWYMIAAIASLLFMVFGCASYILHVTADPALLPLDQRTALAAQPGWVIGAYAVTVWAGLIGTMLLVLRRRLAQPLLLVSVLSVLAWLGGLLLVPGLRDSISANDLAVALVVAVVTWTIFWFARHSAQRGWLR